MRILITGGAGYIGSIVADMTLESNFQVRVVDCLWFDKKVPVANADNPNYEFIKADLRSDDVLDRCLVGIDIIIHAAAVVGEPASDKFPDLTTDINYNTSIRLIDRAKRSGVKGFIFLSTCSNYGIADGLVNEKAPLKPLSLYARTKVDVERYLIDGNGAGLGWIICRLSTAYGLSRRMRFDLTVNDFTMTAFTKKHLSLYLPYTYRPYIHVSDIGRVIMEMTRRFDEVKNSVYNVGFEGENYQKAQVADVIKSIMPDTVIEHVKSGRDVRDYKVDFSKLSKTLNIKNAFTVENGAREIFASLRDKVIANPYEIYYYNTSPDIDERSYFKAR